MHVEKLVNFEWISKIIESCNNDFHFNAVDILIELFWQKHLDGDLRTQLMILRENKWNEIHSILI